jgi:hypothetical protein
MLKKYPQLVDFAASLATIQEKMNETVKMTSEAGQAMALMLNVVTVVAIINAFAELEDAE